MLIINDILDFSKIEAGKITLEKNPFNLHLMMENCLNVLLVRAEEKGLKIRLQVDADVPACMVGDHGRFCQVLTNLVGNAIKFSQQGQISVAVSLAAPVKDDVMLQVRVSDTGIGIAEEACRRIFNQFEQADGSTTRKFGGTGLGLTICKKLVTLMGGDIWVESQLGVGSCFHFTACFQRGSEELPPTGRSGAVTPSQIRQAPLDVLVVDDVEINRAIVQAILEPHGFRITCAENGLKALEAIKAKRFDVVLMDIQMPEMDGLQATRAIRNFERVMERSVPVPIIAMTAIAGSKDRRVCIEAGMNDYFTKPIKPGQLLQLLKGFCLHPVESLVIASGDCPAAAAPEMPPDESDKSAPVFARNELLERLGGRSEMIPRFVDLFLNGVLPQMDGLVAALAAGDADGVWRHAHAIKGSAGNIAALRMHETAAMIEKAAKEGDLTEAPQRLAMLQEQYREFSEAVHASSGCK